MKKLKGYIETFGRYKGLLMQLVSRDLKIKYRRSVLGYLWSLLNPLLMMLVLAAVFGALLRPNIPNFTIYLLTGQVMFNFFSESTNLAMGSIVSSASLIRKVYIPKYLFPLSKIAFSFVNLLFSLLAVVLMLIITQTPITWTILAFPLPLIYMAIFATGMGMLLSALTVFFRDIMHLYGVLLQAWMYLTPIIYDLAIIPEEYQFLMNANPLYHYVTCFREIVMNGTFPGLKTHLYCLFFALVALIIGVWVFYKKQDRFILYT